MSYEVIARAAYGLPDTVTNADGSPRPRLARPAKGLAVHYTGVDVPYGNRDRDTAVSIQRLEAVARDDKKPFEYNYIVHQKPDRLIHEYAGHFRAAHSAGNNATYYGVLLLNGTAEPPTAEQIKKVRWLRAHLIAQGALGANSEIRPHQRMPGQEGATQCPGKLVMARWAEFEVPWSSAESSAAASPAASAAPAPSAIVRPTAAGEHRVRPGDTAETIAQRCFGSADRAAEIAAANASVAAGGRCSVPGFAGTWVTVRAGWGPLSCIEAAGYPRTMAAVERFWLWNGGDPAAGEREPLMPGEKVWVEDFRS